MIALIAKQDRELDRIILRRVAVDDAGLDDLAVQLLSAFAKRVRPVPLDAAHDAISWLTQFVHMEPALVQ